MTLLTGELCVLQPESDVVLGHVQELADQPGKLLVGGFVLSKVGQQHTPRLEVWDYLQRQSVCVASYGGASQGKPLVFLPGGSIAARVPGSNDLAVLSNRDLSSQHTLAASAQVRDQGPKEQRPWQLAVVGAGTKLVCVGMAGAVTVWDLATREIVLDASLEILCPEDVLELPCGDLVVLDCSSASCIDLATGELKWRSHGQYERLPNSAASEQLPALHAIAVSGVSCDKEEQVAILDSRTGERLKMWQPHTGRTTGLAALPDGKTLVTCSGVTKDGASALKVWDASTGECSREVKTPSPVHCIAVLQGRAVVGACEDGALRVWDLATGELVQVLEGGHKAGQAAKQIIVLQNDRLASVADGKLCVWK